MITSKDNKELLHNTLMQFTDFVKVQCFESMSYSHIRISGEVEGLAIEFKVYRREITNRSMVQFSDLIKNRIQEAINDALLK